jgi:Holliday junction DNA helicase RuvA
MIGSLRGQIIHKQPPYLILEVQGVGYEMQSPMTTFYNLIDNSQAITLYTHMTVREDAQILYGFTQLAERTLFRTLLKVSGVGGKMALAILSGMTTAEFQQAIQTSDITTLTALPGIGKKTAERLVVEMKDRLPTTSNNPSNTTETHTSAPHNAKDDAHGALIALGYKPAEAQRMLKNITHEGLPVEAIIRQALQTTRI